MRIQPDSMRGVDAQKETKKTSSQPRVGKKELSGSGADVSAPKAKGSDKVEISSKGRDVAKATALAKEAPDVNEAKVAALKAKIESGTYAVDPEKLADRIVEEHIATPFD